MISSAAAKQICAAEGEGQEILRQLSAYTEILGHISPIYAQCYTELLDRLGNFVAAAEVVQ